MWITIWPTTDNSSSAWEIPGRYLANGIGGAVGRNLFALVVTGTIVFDNDGLNMPYNLGFQIEVPIPRKNGGSRMLGSTHSDGGR